MEDSRNDGFAVVSKEEMICKVRYLGKTIEYKVGDTCEVPENLGKIIETVCKEEDWLLI